VAKNTIEIVINQTGNAIKGVGAVADVVTGLAGNALGAVKPLLDLGKAIFEVGNAGAKVAQTKASFDGLGVSLEALRKASGGTVDDMTLMSATLTLMAGASGDLAAGLGEATPQLMEIAKAANKLNPTLGDTAFLYESISTGIKRGSPMILDNLGLVISQEKANKDYAAALGKTAAQLTDNEKKLALLNEVLAKGDVLIQQAGGNTASAADGFDRFKASLGNYTDAAKAAYAGTGGLFDVLAGGLDALTEFQNKWTEFYVVGILGLGTAADQASLSMNRLGSALSNATSDITFMNTEMAQATTIAGQNQFALTSTQDAIIKYDAAVRANTEATNAQKDAYLSAAAALGEMSMAQYVAEQINALSEAEKNGTITTEQYLAAKESLLTTSGLLTDAERSAQSAIDSVTASYASGRISADAYALAVSKIKSNIDGLQDKTVTITVEMRGDAQAYANAGVAVNAPAKGGPSVAMQSGFNGIFTRPTMAIFGEGGPEMVTAQPLSNVTNNYNLSVNSVAAAASVVDDFNMMRAFAGRP